MYCMEDEGAKQGNVPHSSNYIKLVFFFCCFISQKLLSNIQTSEVKNTACPCICLLQNSDLKNEICFARFILFTALIITWIKHVLQRLTGATDLRRTKLLQLFRNSHPSELQGHSFELAVLET